MRELGAFPEHSCSFKVPDEDFDEDSMSELFRNALWLNYLEKPSESLDSLGLSEPKAVLCQIENRAIDDLLVAHKA